MGTDGETGDTGDVAGNRFEGVSIPDPGFAGDTGEPHEAVTAALAAYQQDPRRYADALATLSTSRLLVPVVAVADEVEVDAAGLTHDKSSDMAAVLLTGQDGRMALLAFTGMDRLTRWRDDARPVPVTARDAARAALGESAAALVIDVGGPVRFVVEGENLRRLAKAP